MFNRRNKKWHRVFVRNFTLLCDFFVVFENKKIQNYVTQLIVFYNEYQITLKNDN